MSQFFAMLLLATSLTLTLCVGVAAWRVSAGKDADITATIPRQVQHRSHDLQQLNAVPSLKD